MEADSYWTVQLSVILTQTLPPQTWAQSRPPFISKLFSPHFTTRHTAADGPGFVPAIVTLRFWSFVCVCVFSTVQSLTLFGVSPGQSLTSWRWWNNNSSLYWKPFVGVFVSSAVSLRWSACPGDSSACGTWRCPASRSVCRRSRRWSCSAPQTCVSSCASSATPAGDTGSRRFHTWPGRLWVIYIYGVNIFVVFFSDRRSAVTYCSGVSPVCVRLWTSRWFFLLNDFPHVSQMKSLTPVVTTHLSVIWISMITSQVTCWILAVSWFEYLKKKKKNHTWI